MMGTIENAQGYLQCGMPYNKVGCGSKPLVVFQGLVFENKPMPGFIIKQFSKMYGCLEKDHTVYVVNRKPGMPQGGVI